jgi:hypothetical protein
MLRAMKKQPKLDFSQIALATVIKATGLDQTPANAVTNRIRALASAPNPKRRRKAR